MKVRYFRTPPTSSGAPVLFDHFTLRRHRSDG